MYTYSPYSREEAACWNVASCSWEGGDTGWVHTSAPGCRGQDASSLGSLVFVSLATGLSYPLPTPILLPSPNCRASSSENSLFRRTLVVSSLIVSRLHWIFCKERKSAGFKLDRRPISPTPPFPLHPSEPVAAVPFRNTFGDYTWRQRLWLSSQATSSVSV